MDYGKLTLDEIQKGYRVDANKTCLCNYCEKAFPAGQVFSIGEHFYDPEHAAAMHIEADHGGNLAQLLLADTKYNTLTDNQKELLSLFYANASDSEIAKKLGVSPSTVRRQKFTFREKAKQAKLYLAIFECVFGNKTVTDDTIIPIPNNAMHVDDRFVITERESARILKTAFESLEPLRLKVFPVKEKKKIVILMKIAEQFAAGTEYTEKEVNQIIKPIYEDFVTIRRYLIMYGFIDRTPDGSRYWLA